MSFHRDERGYRNKERRFFLLIIYIYLFKKIIFTIFFAEIIAEIALKKGACFFKVIFLTFFFAEMIADIALKKGETSLSELSRNLSKAVDPLSFAAGFYQE